MHLINEIKNKKTLVVVVVNLRTLDAGEGGAQTKPAEEGASVDVVNVEVDEKWVIFPMTDQR